MVAVRAHPSVDLLEDRLFSLSCGRAAAGQSKPDISLVSLSLRDGARELRAGQAGVSYNLRAELSEPRPNTGLMVRNCLAFNLAGTVVTLVDDRGCRPNDNFISEWSYDQSGGRADTTLWTLIPCHGEGIKSMKISEHGLLSLSSKDDDSSSGQNSRVTISRWWRSSSTSPSPPRPGATPPRMSSSTGARP